MYIAEKTAVELSDKKNVPRQPVNLLLLEHVGVMSMTKLNH